MKMDNDDELRDEYCREDLGEGVRAKYYDEYMKNSNIVVLDPDVAAAFPNARAVNEALRKLLTGGEQKPS